MENYSPMRYVGRRALSSYAICRLSVAEALCRRNQTTGLDRTLLWQRTRHWLSVIFQ